jgi:ferric-dicitrate binding protein FerR (iron transport regulator)
MFSKKQGAALSLPLTSQRQDTLLQDEFRRWIVAHIDSWFAFSQVLGMGAKMEDIVLVTGCHRTRAWANLASRRAPAGSRLCLGVRITNAGANVHWTVSDNRTRARLNTQHSDYQPAIGEVRDTQITRTDRH